MLKLLSVVLCLLLNSLHHNCRTLGVRCLHDLDSPGKIQAINSTNQHGDHVVHAVVVVVPEYDLVRSSALLGLSKTIGNPVRYFKGCVYGHGLPTPLEFLQNS